MLIRELFDPEKAAPLEWDASPGVTYAGGHVNIKGVETPIDITFADQGDKIVNIEFQVGGNFEMTGKGGVDTVFATVIAGVKQFVEEHPGVNIVTFTAEEKSRARMYDTITKRVAKQLGWHVIPYEEMAQDPRMKTAMSYGAFLFAIERGQAPAHRQAAQKPQHSEFLPILYVYAYENPELPAIKLKAKSATAAEKWVIQNIPGYEKEHPMSVFAVKAPPEGRKIIDKGTVPAAKPKPPERKLTDLEQKLKDKLGEADFAGQQVQGNAFTKFKEQFPYLSTLMYFIPGLGPALMAADMASQVQMYNQAIAEIEKKYPEPTIQAAQQRVGDPVGDIEPIEFNEGYINHWGKPKPKFTAMERAIMEGGGSLEEYYEKNINGSSNHNANGMQFIKGLLAQQVGRKSK